MEDDVKKMLVKTLGAVIGISILAFVIIKLFSSSTENKEDYYQEVKCENGKKVYRILTAKFDEKYQGHKLGLDIDVKDKLKSSIGIEDKVLQDEDTSIKNLRNSIMGLITTYNLDPCSEKSSSRLDKIADYIINYSLLAAKAAQIQALVKGGNADDLKRARQLIAEQTELANSVSQKLTND